MFKSARIKLTLWYLAIIMLVSISFSVVVFRIVGGEVNRFSQMQRNRIERELNEYTFGTQPGTQPGNQPRPPFAFTADPQLIQSVKNRLAVNLALTNLFILCASGVLGYLLAGRTLKPIQTMLDEQNRFISDASHEFKTPLTSLKSSMEVFLRDKEPKIEEAKILIKDSIGDVDKLNDLSTSLLELAQYENPNGNLKFEELSLNTVVKEAISKVTPIAKKKDIKINSALKEALVEGNKYSLVDLFVILLENAVKYSKAKSSIDVSSNIKDKVVVVTVKDYGQGIDEKDQPYIFNRFFRSDKSRNKNEVSGYGLGLSIAKRIIIMHNGSISVDSKLNNGSVFSVTLPLKKQSK